MPDPTLDPTGHQPVRTRLNGWKEIAAYLGRGVRTAQRWETEFGLPVRRMGQDRGDSVFAYVADIDAWLASGKAERAREAKPDVVSDPDARHASRPKVRRWVVWGLALLAGAVGLAGFGFWRAADSRRASLAEPPAAPSRLRIDLDTLVAEDANGKRLWSHAFGFPLATHFYEPGADGQVPHGIEDVDGDGTRETWFISRGVQGGQTKSALWLFSQDGSPRWSYAFAGEVRFGDTTFGVPWAPRHVLVSPAPEDHEKRAMWVVSIEREMFPSLLQRVDLQTGRPLSTYWSNGHIVSLALTERLGRQVLLAGGANNDRRAPGIAVLDAMNPNGSAPSVQDKYKCTSCPPGHPLAYVVLPRPRRFEALDAQGVVLGMDVTRPGQTGLLVVHAFADTPPDALAVYRLDSRFQPTFVDVADNYQSVYELLRRRGRIPAFSPAQVDPEREFLPILHWVDGKFVKVGKP